MADSIRVMTAYHKGLIPDCTSEGIAPSDTTKFMFEVIMEQKSIPLIVNTAELKSYRELANTTRTRADYLNDIIFARSRTKLPKGATPEQRAKAVKKVLDNKATMHRFIFSQWPRPDPVPGADKMDPPPYQYITPRNSCQGKMAPNENEFWGATLFDFYHVRRFPDVRGLATISTATKLANWAKKHGEADGPAVHCIEWAEDAEDPQLIPPCDIRQLIMNIEDDSNDKVTDEFPEEQSLLTEPWPPESVFDARAYPRGWARKPFSDNSLRQFGGLPLLQHYIKQHRLPEKLVVHDPWQLLTVGTKVNSKDSMEWEEKVEENPDSTHIYRLQLSKDYKERRQADEDEDVKAMKRATGILETFLANPHSSCVRPEGIEVFGDDKPGPVKPAIFVVYPEKPTPALVKEAHLHLSPAHSIGKGNHSVVYHAEWEVPRSFLFEDAMCEACVLDDVIQILAEEDGDHGEKRDGKWDEESGKIILEEKVKEPVFADDEWPGVGRVTYCMQQGYKETQVVYEGPFRIIHTRVKYQNLERGPYCVHLSRGKEHTHSLATTVRVAAKLSTMGDEHLAREAENYQQFPKHFFEHWSGYNIVYPLQEPVPVGPLVPQFYGYYVPEDREERKEQAKEEGISTHSHRRYLSPILLLEYCGEPIQANELSADDKNECMALGLRFNAAKWYHGSFAQRNILRQAGPLSDWPLTRMINMNLRGGYGVNWAFRLIDFGRSKYAKEKDDTLVVQETTQIRGIWEMGNSWH